MSKQSVSVVCHQCRRPYVLKVDLEQVRQDRPRAVCSRCGERFDVYARLGERTRREPKTAAREDSLGVQSLAPLLGGAAKDGNELATPDPGALSAREARREEEIRAAVTPPAPDRHLRPKRHRAAQSSGQWTLELDLGRPFPWAREDPAGLDALAHDYGPSASVVEWLLTEVSDDHGRETPPPIPIDARKTLPPSVIVSGKEEPTAEG